MYYLFRADTLTFLLALTQDRKSLRRSLLIAIYNNNRQLVFGDSIVTRHRRN